MKLPTGHWLTRARRTTLREELDELDSRVIRIVLAIMSISLVAYYVLRDRDDLNIHVVLTALSRKF